MIKKWLVITVFLQFVILIPCMAKTNTVSIHGFYESTLLMQHHPEYKESNDDYFTYGMNNLANLRFFYKTSHFRFGVDLNVFMLAGSYTQAFQQSLQQQASSFILVPPLYTDKLTKNYYSMPFYTQSTYVGALEIDRLYFSTGNLYYKLELGLLRLARGYGYIFSPSDLFNPANPLNPNARKQGKLSLINTFYPLDMWKIQIFAIAPDNPVEQAGWDSKFGTATNFSIDRFDFEFLYTLFLPEVEYESDLENQNLPESVNNDFTHIFGFSFKADIKIGLFLDIVYRLEQRNAKTWDYYNGSFQGWEGWRGLEAAIGIDYTINKVYFLAEYMFYGSGILDWQELSLENAYDENHADWDEYKPFDRRPDQDKKSLPFLRHDYFSFLLRWTINDYVTLAPNLLLGLDDQSLLFSLSSEIEPFQAFTVTVKAMFPFDKKAIGQNSEAGEYSYTNLGFFQAYQFSAKLKF